MSAVLASIRKRARRAAKADAELVLTSRDARALVRLLDPGPDRPGLCLRCHDEAVDEAPDDDERALRQQQLRDVLGRLGRTTQQVRAELDGYEGESGYRRLTRDLRAIGAQPDRSGVWRRAS